MNTQKIFSALASLILIVAASFIAPAKASTTPGKKDETRTINARVRVPLNLAILIQDDLVSRVGNELALTRDFIRSLPVGSQVMVGYITSGSLQVRQKFTPDLDKAAETLRIPAASTAVSPYNPYVEVIEALRRFDSEGKNRNAILLISDGLDIAHGFDIASNANTPDLLRAIREAKRRGVAVYSFYAPSVGLTSWNRTAALFGQGSLNRLSNETGGQAFFQGTSFVTFHPYFENLSRAINEKYAGAY